MFANSPQQNLPIGCPGLAKLPNSISFLWESDGLASWYSEGHEQERTTVINRRKRRKKDGAEALTAVYGLHLPIDGVPDHQGADKELSPPKRVTDRRNTIKD